MDEETFFAAVKQARLLVGEPRDLRSPPSTTTTLDDPDDELSAPVRRPAFSVAPSDDDRFPYHHRLACAIVLCAFYQPGEDGHLIGKHFFQPPSFCVRLAPHASTSLEQVRAHLVAQNYKSAKEFYLDLKSVCISAVLGPDVPHERWLEAQRLEGFADDVWATVVTLQADQAAQGMMRCPIASPHELFAHDPLVKPLPSLQETDHATFLQAFSHPSWSAQPPTQLPGVTSTADAALAPKPAQQPEPLHKPSTPPQHQKARQSQALMGTASPAALQEPVWEDCDSDIEVVSSTRLLKRKAADSAASPNDGAAEVGDLKPLCSPVNRANQPPADAKRPRLPLPLPDAGWIPEYPTLRLDIHAVMILVLFSTVLKRAESNTSLRFYAKRLISMLQVYVRVKPCPMTSIRSLDLCLGHIIEEAKKADLGAVLPEEPRTRASIVVLQRIYFELHKLDMFGVTGPADMAQVFESASGRLMRLLHSLLVSTPVHFHLAQNGVHPSKTLPHRVDLESIQFKDMVFRAGDWLMVLNRANLSRPTLGQVRACWINQITSQVYFDLQIYLGPEDVLMEPDQPVLPSEVFRTWSIACFPIEEFVDRCAVLSLADYLRGRPKFGHIRAVYVCRSGYDLVLQQFTDQSQGFDTYMPAGYRAPELELFERPLVLTDLLRRWTCASAGEHSELSSSTLPQSKPSPASSKTKLPPALGELASEMTQPDPRDSDSTSRSPLTLPQQCLSSLQLVPVNGEAQQPVLVSPQQQQQLPWHQQFFQQDLHPLQEQQQLQALPHQAPQSAHPVASQQRQHSVKHTPPLPMMVRPLGNMTPAQLTLLNPRLQHQFAPQQGQLPANHPSASTSTSLQLSPPRTLHPVSASRGVACQPNQQPSGGPRQPLSSGSVMPLNQTLSDSSRPSTPSLSPQVPMAPAQQPRQVGRCSQGLRTMPGSASNPPPNRPVVSSPAVSSEMRWQTNNLQGQSRSLQNWLSSRDGMGNLDEWLGGSMEAFAEVNKTSQHHLNQPPGFLPVGEWAVELAKVKQHFMAFLEQLVGHDIIKSGIRLETQRLSEALKRVFPSSRCEVKQVNNGGQVERTTFVVGVRFKEGLRALPLSPLPRNAMHRSEPMVSSTVNASRQGDASHHAVVSQPAEGRVGGGGGLEEHALKLNSAMRETSRVFEQNVKVLFERMERLQQDGLRKEEMIRELRKELGLQREQYGCLSRKVEQLTEYVHVARAGQGLVSAAGGVGSAAYYHPAPAAPPPSQQPLQPGGVVPSQLYSPGQSLPQRHTPQLAAHHHQLQHQQAQLQQLLQQQQQQQQQQQRSLAWQQHLTASQQQQRQVYLQPSSGGRPSQS